MNKQKFFAVRVVIKHGQGTIARDYVRGEKRMGQEAFTAWALGDLLMLTDTTGPLTWTVEEIDFETVRQQRIQSRQQGLGSWVIEPSGVAS